MSADDTGKPKKLVLTKLVEISPVPQGANQHAHGVFVKSAPSTPQEVQMNPEVQKSIDEGIAKALADAAIKADAEKADAVEKARKEGQTEIEKLRSDLGEIQKAAAIGKQVEIVKSTMPNVGNPDEIGGALYLIHKQAPEAYEPIAKAFRAMSTQISKSGLFKTAGVAGNAEVPTAAQEVEKAAAEIRKSRPSLSEAEAMQEACRANPDLYTRYNAEQAGG